MAKVEMRAQDVLERFYGSNGIVLPVDVVGIANENGINVNRARFSGAVSDLVYGFIEKDGTGVSITVNACNSLTRRRFTIAHELGHFFLHHDGEELEYLDLRSTKKSQEEQEANQFAAELLMPETEVKVEYEKLMFPTVEALAKKFGVSKQAMQYRLKNLGLSAIQMEAL